jgi:hypothetical protein
MTSSTTDPISEELERVATWPPEQRLVLARRILETLEKPAAESRSTRTGSIRDLLGLLRTEGEPPSDEECQRMLEEELLRKYGA